MTAYILTMIFVFNNNSSAHVVAEYSSQETCQRALDTNREILSSGRVVLATCTKK